MDPQQRSKSIDRIKLLCYCIGCLLDFYEFKAREILQTYTTIKNASSYHEYKRLGRSSQMLPDVPATQPIGQQISWVRRIGPLVRLLIGKGTMRQLYARRNQPTQLPLPGLDGSLLTQVFLFLWRSPNSAAPEHSRKRYYGTPFATYFPPLIPSCEYARDIISYLQVGFIPRIQSNAC